jgi:putative ABC transport system permease protein
MLSLPPAAQDDLAKLNILTQGKQSGGGHVHGEHCNHSHVHEHSAHCNHGPTADSSAGSSRPTHSHSSHNHSHTHEHGAHCNH